MSTRLEGKVAFVTGARGGMGRTHAQCLARHGADIVAVDMTSPDDDVEFKQTIALVEETGRRIVAQAADVRQLDQLEAAAAAGMEAFGRLDVVVANAGVIRLGNLSEMSQEDWQLTFDVNVLGAWLTCKATVPHLIAGGRGGSVVLVSSVLGLRGSPLVGGYAASKHAVVGLGTSLAQELGPHGIRVNTVHPTNVDTPMLRTMVPEGVWDNVIENYWKPTHLLPVGVIEPMAVSDAVAFLASDEARYITGVALPVDAGFLAK